jgi:putative AlgH/UPF0301 family transcriptional regulator
MEYTDELTGRLLVSLPNTAHHQLARSVMLVTANWPTGSSSMMINKPLTNGYNVSAVMRNAGLEYRSLDPVFLGGPHEQNRIQVIHTLDWQCNGTKTLTRNLGITGELSVLAAISHGEGPRLWRCVTGQRLTGPDELDDEIKGSPPLTPDHGWLVLDATIDNVFTTTGDQQWFNSIDESSKLHVASWF